MSTENWNTYKSQTATEIWEVTLPPEYHTWNPKHFLDIAAYSRVSK